jgi:formate dehydrogenase major subunit
MALFGEGGKAVSAISRRDFLKIGAAGAGGVGLSALGFDLAQAYQIKQTLRIAGARESHSVCPYCAVGCSLIAFTDDSGKLLQIEGDPDSPVNEGRLCPKGASAMQLAVAANRVESVLYRGPKATSWKKISWDQAMGMLAQRVKDSRDRTFVTTDASGNTVNRCEGIAFAGGAAFSSEEGYFATKVMRGLGLVHLEQQARV